MWIRTVPPEDAEGLLHELYEAQAMSRGRYFRLLTLWPEVLIAREQLEREVRSSSLGQRNAEMLMVLTAALVGCGYCSAQHARALVCSGLADEHVHQLRRDYRQLDLDAGERAMLDYCAVLTVAPWRIGESDVQRLRAAGLDDRQILEVNQICAFMNMVTRTNHGLGLRPPEHVEEPDQAWLRGEILAGRAP